MALDSSNFGEAIKNTTNETIAMAEKAVKETAVERKDAAVLEILKAQDPDTYRIYLAKAEQAAALPRVKPGDLITAELINALIDRINALEGMGESVLTLGSLALQTHTLIALGGDEKSGAGLWLDGERLLDKAGEVANLVLLDGAKLDVRLALSGDSTKLGAAIEQVMKEAQKGDVLMAQFDWIEKSDPGEAGVSVTSNQKHTYIGAVQDSSSLDETLQFLNSIQVGHQPFSWALYSTRLKRFVLGGSSDDFRLKQQFYVKRQQ